MAFMVPVVRQDYDLYNSRSRHTSTCSSRSRSRKSSECKSEPLSMSVSPQDNFLGSSPGRRIFSGRLSRTSSRSTAPELISPTSNTAPSTPKSSSNTSLDKFHIKVVDKLKRALKIRDSSEEEEPKENNAQTNS